MKQPKIRFKGFQGDWVKTPFSEMVNRVSASASSLNYPGVEFEDINSGEGTLNKDVSRKKTVKIGKQFTEGDILFGKLRPYLKNILLADFNGVAIGDFWVLRPQKVTSELLYILVNSREFMRVANISSGSKMPRADWNLVSSTSFAYPNSKGEQNAIGAYFQHIDSLIQSTAKKIESLKQVKAASLQSMFPQEGETSPRVRFKGFEGKWNEYALGTLFGERCESDIDAEMLSVTINQGIIKASENGRFDSSNSDKSKYKLVRIGDIAYNSMRMWQGACGCSPYEGIVSPAYTVVVPQNNVCSLFFYYMFKTNRMLNTFRLNSQGLTSDTWNLKYPIFSKLRVFCPETIEEQQTVSAYFKSLDSQISFQSQRLEKLKQIKSACLDNMFV